YCKELRMNKIVLECCYKTVQRMNGDDVSTFMRHKQKGINRSVPLFMIFTHFFRGGMSLIFFVYLFLLCGGGAALAGEDSADSVLDPLGTEVYSSKITCGSVEIIATTVSDSYTPYMDPEKSDASAPENIYVQKLSFFDLKTRKIRGVALWLNPLYKEEIDWTIGPLKCTQGKNGEYLLAHAASMGLRQDWEEIYDMDGRHLTEVEGKYDENHARRILKKTLAVKKELGINDTIDILKQPRDESIVVLKAIPVNRCSK
ncbi:MAG: hypothetical protein V2B20_24500, partial [Pseudomonadota bacterium]